MIINAQNQQSFTVNMQLLPTLIITLQPTSFNHMSSQLEVYISNAPKMFTGANAILDLGCFDNAAIELDKIIQLLHAKHLTVIGVRHCPSHLRAHIDALHLPIIHSQKTQKPNQPPKKRRTLFHNKQIRSGQQIYAQDSDLVITGAISPGAEIIADGDIHVYGVMGGKAIAGASGNLHAQFFIQQFSGELCAIAGNYLTFEQIPHNRPIHGYIQENQLQIDCIKS